MERIYRDKAQAGGRPRHTGTRDTLHTGMQEREVKESGDRSDVREAPKQENKLIPEMSDSDFVRSHLVIGYPEILVRKENRSIKL